MSSIAKSICYFIGALLAAVYWYSIAWLCFSLTGHDPIDVVTGLASSSGVIVTILIFAVAILVFALIGKRLAIGSGGTAA